MAHTLWSEAARWFGRSASPQSVDDGRQRLSVLMYHKVLPRAVDPWTVAKDQLAAQLDWLVARDFTAITCRQLIDRLDHQTPLPQRPILITFDDGYVNNVEHAQPLLAERALCATMFVPTAYLGSANLWDQGDHPILSAADLRALPADVFEIALHSHRHENYERMSADQIADDVRLSVTTLRDSGVAWTPAIAYPFGRFPRRRRDFAVFCQRLAASGIRCGFRIGNRVNRLPIRDRFLMERIDIRATDALADFERKVIRGARWRIGMT